MKFIIKLDNFKNLFRTQNKCPVGLNCFKIVVVKIVVAKVL